MKICKDSFGTVVAVGFKSNIESDIDLEWYSWWLHGAFAESEPQNIVSPNFKWGWTSKAKIIKYYINREINRLYQRFQIEFEGESVKNKLKNDALKYYEELEIEQFVYVENQTRNFVDSKIDYTVIDSGQKATRASDDLIYY